eukprot:3823276-Alexandrium_andersonii.AAC.1
MQIWRQWHAHVGLALRHGSATSNVFPSDVYNLAREKPNTWKRTPTYTCVPSHQCPNTPMPR